MPIVACSVIFHASVVVCCLFSKLTFSINSFRNTIRKSQFGPRSGATFCRSWSGSKQFAKVISRRKEMPLACKELKKKKISTCFSWWLTLKAPITTAADDKIFVTSFLVFEKNKVWYFMRSRRFSWNIIPYLLISKRGKIWNCRLLQIISGALRVNG